MKKEYKNFKFDLFGDIIDVCFLPKVCNKNKWIFGDSNFAEQRIRLSLYKPSGAPLSPQQINQTFIHECVHIMLESGQFLNESNDEPLVEWLGKCINVMFMANKDISSHF